MNAITSWMQRLGLVVIMAALLAACGLPGYGPNKRQIYAGSVSKGGDSFIIEVDNRVARTTAVVPALGFLDSFQSARPLSTDTINPGDVISITVWENVANQLLGQEGPTLLEVVQVDSTGNIFFPYAGRLRAAGKSPEQLRRLITAKLADQTPDPQVEVRREAGDGSAVSVSGTVGSQGVYLIERPTRTVSTMIARAGGLSILPEIAKVTLTRGNRVSSAWYLDLFADPKTDVAVRNGDRILVEADDRSFNVMGAAGSPGRINFQDQQLSVIDALAQSGGLNASGADPTGVFVFRNEHPQIARAVTGRSDIDYAARIAYVLNLTKPNGIFLARDFILRDQDTIYITEAPITAWNKTVQALTGTLTSAGTLRSVASNGLNGLSNTSSSNN